MISGGNLGQAQILGSHAIAPTPLLVETPVDICTHGSSKHPVDADHKPIGNDLGRFPLRCGDVPANMLEQLRGHCRQPRVTLFTQNICL